MFNCKEDVNTVEEVSYISIKAKRLRFRYLEIEVEEHIKRKSNR